MYIYKLSKLPFGENFHFGGKAESLFRLIKNGLPVPFGYGIAAEAFEKNGLSPQAEKELSELLKILPKKYRYAVRSSAVGEDGKTNSFAGAYETVLDIPADEIPEAVKTVAFSASDDRIRAYAKNRGADVGNIAAVIQRFISPEFAGVFFTVDPVSANASIMVGNYVNGVGEALVSGDGSDGSFKINAIKYRYEGSEEFRPYAKKLYAYAKKIVSIFGCPQDIEWAVFGGKIYILQARPITAIFKNKLEEFLINDSLCSDLLLSKTNVGEIFLRSVSPAAYSIVRIITDALGIPLVSNVLGQLYLNISGLCSMLVSFGFTKKKAINALSELTGGIPQDLDIPIYPFDKQNLHKRIFKLITGEMFRKNKTDFGKSFKTRIAEIGNEIISEIRSVSTLDELNCIFDQKCTPYFNKTLSAIMTGLSLQTLFAARKKLEAVCGGELADRLLSDCSENGNIESLGGLLAVDDVINGKMSKEEYTARYGHRHADEMELSVPYPYEDPNFPENVIEDYIKSGIDVRKMKAEQEKRRLDAVKNFKQLYPSKSKWLDKLLKKYSEAVYTREKVRSDALRIMCVIREFYLKAGQLTGLDDDIFLLYFDEVKTYISGNNICAEKIPLRKENYAEQLKMPNFPSVICGRFTVSEWRQSGGNGGYYRFGEACSEVDKNVISGVAGSCGQAEGYARVLTSVVEADLFEKGEILVVPAANIGWVKVFPKAAAVVTDVGAPLSHAVIVARELGIPAVVSCQCASSILKTGDKIRVDGTAGKVILLD